MIFYLYNWNFIMSFFPLVDRQEFIPLIARQKYDEFSYLTPNKTVAEFEKGVRTHLNRDTLPITYVKLSDSGEFLGTYSLRVNHRNLTSHHHLTPWLASLFVPIEHRRMGVGASLVKDAEEKAALLGIKQLFLFTPDQSAWYEKLGWSILDSGSMNNIPVFVMSKSIQ